MRSSSLRRIMVQCHRVVVGAHSYGCFDPIRFPPGTRLGRYVSVGPEVAVYRRNHPLGRLSLHPYFYRTELSETPVTDVPEQPLIVADDAWIGARALILPGCNRIGRGAVVAAGSLVTHDVPDYAVVAGNPARLVRYRFEAPLREAAECTRWWRRPPDDVAARYQMHCDWRPNERELAQ
jgi:acetyltransferase-like isoleucine patch superfamily enzyme